MTELLPDSSAGQSRYSPGTHKRRTKPGADGEVYEKGTSLGHPRDAMSYLGLLPHPS